MRGSWAFEMPTGYVYFRVMQHLTKFSPTTCAAVHKITIKVKHAQSDTYVPTEGVKELLPLITEIVNSSFRSTHVPKSFKSYCLPAS